MDSIFLLYISYKTISSFGSLIPGLYKKLNFSWYNFISSFNLRVSEFLLSFFDEEFSSPSFKLFTKVSIDIFSSLNIAINFSR